MSVLEAKDLTKFYGSQCVLESVNVTFQENKIYGLLGRNGAGKTTLLNMLTNRIFPTAGAAMMDGEPVAENDRALEKLFFMTEKQLYPEKMSVKECFQWTGRFYPGFDSEYAAALCRKFGLNPSKKQQALSTGYQSIAKIITALATRAPVLIFDEPVLGLDANHRELFYKELLQDYIDHPKTIILSTHIIEEIADLLEHVVILKDRRVMIDDSVEHLLSQAYRVSGPQAAVEEFVKGKNSIHTERMSTFRSDSILGECGEAQRKQARELKVELDGIELQKLFIHLTNTEEEAQ